MANKPYLVEEEISRYVESVSRREPGILRRLREETASHPRAIMQISPEQGQLFALLVQLIGAKKTLEVGVFTGYSSLAVALALPTDGRVLACDVNEEYTAVARRYWREAGVISKIDLRLAPASDTLERLLVAGEAGTFDFAFIDADKTGYWRYYELCLELLRRGGLIAVDNVLQRGRVTDPATSDPDVEAIRAFNERLCGDQRVALSMLPFADGLTLAMKR